MKEKRASNNIKQKQLQTKSLEEQTKKMEDQLSKLKRQIQDQKKMRIESNLGSTVTRWQKTTQMGNGPLKSYAKQILEEQKQAYVQFGINQKKVTGTKAFEGVLKKIKQEKQVQQELNPTKITTFLKQPENIQQIHHQEVLQNNFFRAKMDVKKLIKQKTLQDFLEENFILQYLPTFKQAGINDLEGLRYANKERLAELGVKAGHQIKIIKKIKEQFEKLLSGKYEYKARDIESEKVESGYGQGNINTYDNVQKLQKQQQVSKIQVQSKIQKQGDQESYEQQERDLVFITPPMHQVSLQISQQPKQNCYECYRPVTNLQWRYDEKHFCSQNCLEKYLSQLRKNCPACAKVFIKTEGYREEGLWFCSLGCCPNQQEIQEIFFQWHVQAK